MIWLTSDHHFGHKNILQYCKRDFEFIETHDENLIHNWNVYVKPDDIVYHLGDFTLGEDATYYFHRLNGNICVLETPWHHDKRWLRKKTYISGSTHLIGYYPAITMLEDILPDVPVILCHYPFASWDRQHYGSLHFHGHSHGTLDWKINRLDVGVDNAFKLLGEYRPFSLDEAVEIARQSG